MCPAQWVKSRKRLFELSLSGLIYGLKVSTKILISAILFMMPLQKKLKKRLFFAQENPGTLISSAFKLCKHIIETDYDPNEWNIYPFHFSDGDNWSADDTKMCLSLLDDHILPASNMFCYGQVESRYGSGQFYKDLNAKYHQDHEKVILSKIKNKDAILDSIKEFLGKGK